MDIRIPGRVWGDYIGFDNVEEKERDLGLDGTQRIERSVGRGTQILYRNVSPESGRLVADELIDRGEMLKGQDELAHVHRSAVLTGERIRAELRGLAD